MRNEYCSLRQIVVFVVLAVFPLLYYLDILGINSRETSNELRATINIENKFSNFNTRQPKFLVHFTEWPQNIVNNPSQDVLSDNELSATSQNNEVLGSPTNDTTVTVSSNSHLSEVDKISPSSGNQAASHNATNFNTAETASGSSTVVIDSASAQYSHTASEGTATPFSDSANYQPGNRADQETAYQNNESEEPGSWDELEKPDRAQSIKGPVSLAMQVIISDGEKKRKPVELDEKLKKAIESIDKRVGVAGEQEELRAYIAAKCNELGLNGTMERPRLVYFNTQHKLIYVANPKCGSTSFKKFLLKLGGDQRNYTEMTNVHNEEQNPLLRSLWDEPDEFQELALREYYKVTFVRNPLVRLVSGYRNKIVRVPRDHYLTIIQEIIARNYGINEALHWLPRNKYRPSFEQFVEYLLYNGKVMDNAHWSPYSDNIGLCDMQFDLIGQLETANQHIEQMKEKVPSLQDIPFPMSRTELSRDGYSSEELTTLAFSNLTDILVDKVYKLYEKEIQLLGYSVIGEEKFPFINLTEVEVVDEEEVLY